MDENSKQSKHPNKVNEDSNHRTIKTTPILILPHPQYNKTDSDGSTYPQCSGSINCAPKLSVHYIVSLNNETSLFTSNKSNDGSNHFNKIESSDGERKCLITLPLENVISSTTECDGNSLKPSQSITNQRLLISPTDFLTLSEEGTSHKNPEVRKDVNLSAGSIEMMRRSNNDNNNFAICLDRYCESPLMMDAHKDSQLICDDDASCTGRNSRLSPETPEEINADDLFASTFGTDQHSSLREIVTPIEGESTRTTPVLVKQEIINKIKTEETALCGSTQSMEQNDTKPILTILDPLDAEVNNCTPDSSTFTIITSSQPTSSVSRNTQSVALTAVDIKVLPNGMMAKDSLLLANLAAALPSSLTSKQIAIQVIREDGTSIVLPLTTTKSEADSLSKDAGDLPVSSSMVLAEVVSSNEAIRPFKCELCNSTFTRLGNYTRHKKIHSYPSKEDQRFRCEICSKSFIQRCDLARHLHIHRGTEPHRCPQCGKGYIRHSDLVTHQRFHNKEKPFACPHCSKGFCQRGDLNRHLRSIHLQLKPILCSHCHKKFAKEETLLRHINATHREIVEDNTQLK